MIVFLVLGNMRRSGCGYHFAKRTTNYGGHAHRKAAYSWSGPLLEVRGFPSALKGHAAEVLESLQGMRSECCRVKEFAEGKLLE